MVQNTVICGIWLALFKFNYWTAVNWISSTHKHVDLILERAGSGVVTNKFSLWLPHNTKLSGYNYTNIVKLDCKLALWGKYALKICSQYN